MDQWWYRCSRERKDPVRYLLCLSDRQHGISCISSTESSVAPYHTAFYKSKCGIFRNLWLWAGSEPFKCQRDRRGKGTGGIHEGTSWPDPGGGWFLPYLKPVRRKWYCMDGCFQRQKTGSCWILWKTEQGQCFLDASALQGSWRGPALQSKMGR